MAPASILQWDGYPLVTENVGAMVPMGLHPLQKVVHAPLILVYFTFLSF